MARQPRSLALLALLALLAQLSAAGADKVRAAPSPARGSLAPLCDSVIGSRWCWLLTRRRAMRAARQAYWSAEASAPANTLGSFGILGHFTLLTTFFTVSAVTHTVSEISVT